MGAWLAGLGIIAAQSWRADHREVAAIAFPAITVYAALQLAVLADFTRSMHWDRAPAWCYLLFLGSLLAVGVAGLPGAVRPEFGHDSAMVDSVVR